MGSTSRRILITGAGRGLGSELVKAFTRAGDTVWGSTRSSQGASDLERHVALDLLDEASIAAAASALSEQTDGIDILVNNAGVDARAFGAAAGERGINDISPGAIMSVFEVNVLGTFLVQRHMLNLLRRGKAPLIVNISSQLGSMVVGGEMGSDLAYNVSKSALNMLSRRSSAAFKEDGIAVVMLHPGWLKTDLGGSNADMEVAEAADRIVETISSLSVEDTGRFIRWDGSEHPW